MKSVLVSRYGAYGDCIVTSFLPRLLKEQGFDRVDFEVNQKGFQVLGNNPFIDNLMCYEPLVSGIEKFQDIKDHWEKVSKGYDKFINLYGSLEIGCVSMEGDSLYNLPDDERRKILGSINFYDQTCAWAGYPELMGMYKPELFFTEEEVAVTKQWMEQFKGEFVVLVNLAGTSKHKRFIQAKEVCDRILKEFDDAHIILTGDDIKMSWEAERVTSIVGNKPFMQAVLIAKYCHCVIAMESGLGIGANVWGVPTVFLLTASSPESVCRYAQNSLHIQSPAKCSPCHRGPYEYKECEFKDGYPVCVYFDVDQILENVRKAYGICE